MDEAESRVGSRLGNYLLRGVIGRGGSGVVYRAEHVYLRRPMAVKVLYRSTFNEPEALERFLHEAQTAGVIDHPNIVGVTDFGVAPDGTVYLVMAHVEGSSLDRVLREEGRLPLFRTLVIASQVAHALEAAHERSVIHHDLKPDNILLRRQTGRRSVVRAVDGRPRSDLVEPEGTFDFVTLLDFGAAKYFDQARVGSGMVIGTPAYMAPETAQDGIADRRSDIYSLGVVLYEMLTGSVPFEGEDPTSIMIKQVRDPLPPPRQRCPQAEITPEAERTISRALAKRPEDRYQSMTEMLRDLEHCYGSVRFERSLRALPDGVTDFAALRRPIPLTRVKRRPDPDPLASEPPTPPPVPLSERKDSRHRTLLFGVLRSRARRAGTPPPGRS